MNLSFYIQPANIDTSHADLFLEIDSTGLSYTIIGESTCLALVVYEFSAGESNETVADHIHQVIAEQQVLLQKFNSIQIIYGYAASVLIPEEFMNHNDQSDILELVYGDVSERVIKSDFIKRHAIHNVYVVPPVIELVITHYFGSANYFHIFSLLPDVIDQPGNHLYCIFSIGQLKVLFIIEGKLQLMQTFFYKTSEDVEYQFLHIFRCYDTKAADVIVHLAGMIDPEASLYRGLSEYFLQLKFDSLPQQFKYPEEVIQLPAHYFSHLFALSACV